MGTKERRERIRQATRQGILQGARQIGQQEGWQALTIRKVAEHIEYSPSIVYEYFDSKDAILRAVLYDGFHELAANMERALQTTDHADEQALHIVGAYWNFARTNADLYRLMHGLAGVAMDRSARADAVQAVCTIAANAIVRWADAHEVSIGDPATHADVIWSLMHGWISLTLIDGVYADEERAKQLLTNATQALLRGWQTAAHA